LHSGLLVLDLIGSVLKLYLSFDLSYIDNNSSYKLSKGRSPKIY